AGPNFKLVESGVITAYIEDKYPPMGGALSPEELAKARFFVDTFEKTLGGLTGSLLKASGDPVACKEIEAKIRTSIGVLEALLTSELISSSGPFVIGDRFSIAEFNTAPFVQRLIPVAQHYVGVDVLAICAELKAVRLLQWMEATLERDSVASIRVEDGPLFEGFDRMMARFKV
ncbi:glutathione S-transferase, partial [Ochromonadaceae sp. CCMP2298]